jgi:tetratricopeptide (TPR) repeat protein
VSSSTLRADLDRAIDVLQSFLVHGAHIPALVKLVQVSENAGAEEILNEAQERLLATYLDGGHGAEAQAVAEALLARAPDSAVHAQGLRRALELAGAEDPDATVRAVLDRLRPPPPAVVVPEPALMVEDDLLAGGFDDVEDITVVTIDDDVPMMSMDEALAEFETLAAPAVQPPPVVPDTPRPEEPVEIDLSDVMAALRSSAPQSPSAAPAAADELVSDLSDLESVLNAMRPRSADYQTVTEGASVYERGLQRLEQGQVQEGLADLVEAARVPAMRFQAAARLGREYIKRGQAQAGIDWLGRAADMPPTTPEAGLGVLYDLAAALDHIGERVRAFAVLMEINAEDPGYRDVAQRLEVLARVEDERRG